MKMLSESQEVQGNSDLEAIQSAEKSADKTAGSEVDLSDRQKQILSLMNTNVEYSAEEIAELIGLKGSRTRQLLKELADKGPCVIVGRCADYVLKDNPNVVSVFVHADEKFCLDRAMERNSMTEKEMKKYIEKTDKFRGDFYRYHTGHEWADARNYDLCLNSGKLGFQKCVEEIKAYIKIRFDL